MRWSPGDVIVRREVWQGRPWLANPLYVVEDNEDALVLYQPEGSPWGFGDGDDWPTATGRHPYHGRVAWEGEGPLGIHREGEPFAMWAYWGAPDRSFWGWYLNIQAPYRRTEIGIDSLDLELDLLVTPAREVLLKDEAHVDASAGLGRFSVATAAAIHATGARLKAEVESGSLRWDDRWAGWEPPDALRRPPSLPDGWQDVPARAVVDLELVGAGS